MPFSPPEDKPAPSANGRKPKDDKAQGEANGQGLDNASIKGQPATEPNETGKQAKGPKRAKS